MSWPGRLREGQEIRVPISSLDLLPTFCRLAQTTPSATREWDGVDISSLLDGKPFERKKPLVWAYYNAINEARVAMRHGKWKVLARLDGGRIGPFQNLTVENLAAVSGAKLTDFEIYDLEADISEVVNLAPSNPELLTRLSGRLESEYRALVEDSHVWTPAEK